jgi:hypothetical protein
VSIVCSLGPLGADTLIAPESAFPAGYRQVHVRRILPDDPLVRWLFWLIVAFSIGAPLIVALVFLIED